MKNLVRLFLCFLLLIFFIPNSHAQMSVGLRGGVNFANLSLKEVSESTFKTYTRPSFAVLFNYALNPGMSIQVEPSFSQRGTKISDEASIINNNQNLRVVSKGDISANYIEMPILFQYKPMLGKLEGILSVGPEIRLLTTSVKTKLNTKVFINGQLVEDRLEEVSSSGDNSFRNFDFGIVGGAGIAYPVGLVKIFAEGRYHFGLNNLAGKRQDSDLKIHNRGASAHLGVLLPIGK